MPIFDYRCPVCKTVEEKYTKLEQVFRCGKCGTPMDKLIPSPFVIGEIEPYDCPITGKRITSRAEHNANLKKHNCRLLEPGEARDAERTRRADDEALDNTLCDTIAREVEKLTPKQQENLAKEISND